MLNKFHNLLPNDIKKKIKREYYMRLLSVFLLTLSVSVVVGVFSLLPTYIKMSQDFKLKQKDYTNIQDANAIREDTQKEVLKTKTMLSVIDENLKKKKLTDLLFEALKCKPEGVDVVAFSFNRNSNNLTLDGVAKTRNLVVEYAKKLEENKNFTKVPIPISDLAKNSNLNFRLSIGIVSGEEKSKKNE
jgi:hypothetical protein